MHEQKRLCNLMLEKMKINAASLTPTTLEYSPLIFSSLTLVIDNNLLFCPALQLYAENCTSIFKAVHDG